MVRSNTLQVLQEAANFRLLFIRRCFLCGQEAWLCVELSKTQGWCEFNN